MRDAKEKPLIDLLDLSRKDRISLCKEIRSMLIQRVREERTTESRIKTEMSPLLNNVSREAYESCLLKLSLVRPGII